MTLSEAIYYEREADKLCCLNHESEVLSVRIELTYEFGRENRIQ